MNKIPWTKVLVSIWLILVSIHLTNPHAMHPIILIVVAFLVFLSAMCEIMQKEEPKK